MSSSLLKILTRLVAVSLLLITINTNAFCQANHYCTIEIKNPSAINRDQEIVSVPYNEFIKNVPDSKRNSFKLIEDVTKTEVPFQMEYRGEKAPVNLLLQISCPPGAKISVEAVEGKPKAVIPKTFARFVPERFDDFAWENDKVAFRMFGQALESRGDNAYGIDVWSKRTSHLIVNKWYKNGDYHRDHGEGLDFYGVGLSLGAGDIAFFIKDSIYFTNNFKTWKILDNGPLRSTFQLGYSTKNVAGLPVTVTKTISLDAGSQLNKVEVTCSYPGGSELPIVVGIEKRKGKGIMMLNEKKGIMGYWEPADSLHGITGIGTIIPTPGEVKEMSAEKEHLLASGVVSSTKPYIYYTGSVWNKAGLITSSSMWFSYLSDFAKNVKHPLEVKIVK